MANLILIISLILCSTIFSVRGLSSNCGELMDRTFECVEKLKTSPDAQMLDKKRESIFQKCVPNLPPQCIAMKKANDQCQIQVTKDASLMTLRSQIKQNISKCFDQFPPNSHRFYRPQAPNFGRFAASNQQQQGPSPTDASPIPDPCAPSDESQMRCLKNEMRNDNAAHEIAERLEEKQRECYKEVNSDACHVDGNPQLRECVEKVKQPFMQKATVKMQECMQAAFGASSSSSTRRP